MPSVGQEIGRLTWLGSLCLAIVMVVTACATRSEPSASRAVSNRPLGLDLYRPEPADNPTVPDTVALGQRLFRERLLSRDGSLACADCHQPERAFADSRARSVGVDGRRGPRTVPTLVNRAWGQSFFWDGRMATLEVQVLQPIVAELEMDLAVEEAVERLRRRSRYRTAFREVFGRDVNVDDLARALAAYVRTIQAGSSPYDRYVWGQKRALSENAQEGFRLFRGKANCVLCHAGPNLTDEEFHNTGVAWLDGRLLDQGRYLATGQDDDRGAFKTPTLREVERTAPYMHDGSLVTLEEVIELYNDGGRENPYLDADLRPLRLTEQEKMALIAFLRALTGQVSDGS